MKESLKIIIVSIFLLFITALSPDINLTVTRICCNQIPLLTPVVTSSLRHRRLPEVVLCYLCIKAHPGMTETGEKTALPQSTTNDRVSEKICCVYMNLFTNDVKL